MNMKKSPVPSRGLATNTVVFIVVGIIVMAIALYFLYTAGLQRASLTESDCKAVMSSQCAICVAGGGVKCCSISNPNDCLVNSNTNNCGANPCSGERPVCTQLGGCKLDEKNKECAGVLAKLGISIADDGSFERGECDKLISLCGRAGQQCCPNNVCTEGSCNADTGRCA